MRLSTSRAFFSGGTLAASGYFCSMPRSADPSKTILVKDIPVPVHIYVERRSSSRISLGKEKINIRLPNGLSNQQKNETVRHFLLWAQKQITQKNLYQEREKLLYEEGDTIVILGEAYVLSILPANGNRATIHIRHNKVIELRLPKSITSLEQQQEIIQKLLTKGSEAYFLPKVQERVVQLNKQHFNTTVSHIRLRYMISRWGSCSSTGSISLSSRLLLAPIRVLDYVIIHELAHRLEMNHSPRFWRHVANAMPDYKQAEKWLRKHGADCDY